MKFLALWRTKVTTWLIRRYVAVLRFFLAPVFNDVDYLYRSLDKVEDDIWELQNEKADERDLDEVKMDLDGKADASDVDDLERRVSDLESGD
jgi:hypothetical protein